jgi:carboxymethylenebutenolidase
MADRPRLTARDFHPDVLRLFDQYVHGAIDRRQFLAGASRFAVGAMTATGLLAALSPDFARGEQVPRSDPRIREGWLEFESPAGNGRGRGYLVRPANVGAPLPKVLVIHGYRGLNPHIEDVARRFALANYIAFAPDALFPLGGYPGNEDDARAAFQTLDAEKTRADFLAAAEVLATMPGGNGRWAATGFCWGGGMTSFHATKRPDLAAAAPFYGAAPPAEEVPKIRAELLVVLAGEDERINAGWPAYQAALDAAGTKYELFQPPGTQHGFHNDTTPRYDEAAAKQAWARTLALFERAVRAG